MDFTNRIYDLQSLNFLRNTNLKIGILGGSFDPAHNGHLLISKQAINLYNFDYIIWLVANQNPLKPKYKNTIFTRSANAAKLAAHHKIIVTIAEYDLNIYYLKDILCKLLERFGQNDFTWLMGIDNKSNFHKWHKFEDIAKLCKIIIFDRPSNERLVNNTKFDLKFKPIIAKKQTNNIIVCKGLMNEISSSQIRDTN